MQAKIEDLSKFIACPRCKGTLRILSTGCSCESSDCSSTFPVIHGKPVLIVEERSVFRFSDYKPSHSISLGYKPRRSVVSRFLRWAPSITENVLGEQNLALLLELVRKLPGEASRRILIVGAGDAGAGIQTLRAASDVLIMETDVYFAGSVAIIADAHDLPFVDACFDAVVLQAVLEHVADPTRCAAEAHRVLRKDGLIYAESPFMYPVHLGAYDFLRFSMTGHRRLFRHFHGLKVGVVAGAGAALALAFRSFLLSLSPRKRYQSFVRIVTPFLVFWLKYADRLTAVKPHASDYACTTFFLGRKASEPLSDAEVVSSYQRSL